MRHNTVEHVGAMLGLVVAAWCGTPQSNPGVWANQSAQNSGILELNGQDTLIYSNTSSFSLFSPGTVNLPVADDLRTTAACGCPLSAYRIRVGGGGDGTGTFNVSAGLWDGCPGGSGQLIPGTAASVQDINDWGSINLVIDLSAAPVPIPGEIWLQLSFSTTTAGVIMGRPPEIGSSENSFYYPPSGCNANFGPTLYASFYAQLYCEGLSQPPMPGNPGPPDQATGVSFNPTLTWNGAASGRSPLTEQHPWLGGTTPISDGPGDSRGEWWEQLMPGEWCATQERFVAKGRGADVGGRGICPLDGVCDQPEVRDAFIPDATTPVKTYRIALHVFCNDDGSGCISSVAEVDAQMAAINAIFLPWRMQFAHETNFVHATQFREFNPTEEASMKNAFADSPATKLNVYVVNNDANYSVATFPWDPDALTPQGGIIMHDPHFDANNDALAHEIGHCLGLWHTHHGVVEVLHCGDCYELEGSMSDNTGDRCSDTETTPRSTNCFNPIGNESCSGLPWGATPYRNYMGYAPPTCRDEFTPQQMGRAHCWTDDVVSGWLMEPCAVTYDVYLGTITPPPTLVCTELASPTCAPGQLACGMTYYWQVIAKRPGQSTVGPIWSFTTFGGSGGDCNGNGRPDYCEVIGGQAADCNGNLLPDECDVPPLNPAGADCNGDGVPDACEPDCQMNGVPDDCDLVAGTSPDCQGNGMPDECDIAAGTSQDANANMIPDECDCPPAGAPLPESHGACAGSADCADMPCVAGVCYVPKNRYLSIATVDLAAGGPSALRITDVPTGRKWWLLDHQAPDPVGIHRLGIVPACFNWSLAPAVIHVGDCAVVPDHAYLVQSIRCECDTSLEGGYTPGVLLPTTPEPTPKKWADVVGSFVSNAWSAPNGSVNFDDVVAALKYFERDANAAPLPWMDVHPTTPNALLNFADVFYIVKGFQGENYPFTNPLACP